MFGCSLSSVAYCSYYGKKLDPEPGRCRRTDGKKWRCSKDAHPDSKYCERHMHRGRNRSRKPVESQSASQMQSSSSTVTSIAPAGSGGGGNGGGSFQSIPQLLVAGHSNTQQSLCLGTSSSSQLPLGPGPFGNRYLFFPHCEMAVQLSSLGFCLCDHPLLRWLFRTKVGCLDNK